MIPFVTPGDALFYLARKLGITMDSFPSSAAVNISLEVFCHCGNLKVTPLLPNKET